MKEKPKLFKKSFLKDIGKRVVSAIAVAAMVLPTVVLPLSNTMEVHAETESNKGASLTYGNGQGSITTKNGNTVTGATHGVSNITATQIRGQNGHKGPTTYEFDINLYGTTHHVSGTCSASGVKLSSGSGTAVVDGATGSGSVYANGQSVDFSVPLTVLVPVVMPDGTIVMMATAVAPPPPPPPRGNIQVHKESANPQFNEGNSNYTLEGAEYTVSHPEGDDTVTIDSSGDSDVVENILCFSASVQENVPPKGFSISDEVFDGEVPENDTGHVYVANEPYRMPVKILLVKDDGELTLLNGDRKDISSREPQGDGVLSGAEFHVALYDTEGGKCILEFDTVSLGYEGNDYGIVDFSKPDTIRNFESHTGFTLEDYYNFDSDGYFSFPLGYLVVTETKAPTGYTLDTTYGETFVTVDGAEVKGPSFTIKISEDDATIDDAHEQAVSTDDFVITSYDANAQSLDDLSLVVDKTTGETLGAGSYFVKQEGDGYTLYYCAGKPIVSGKDDNGIEIVTGYTPLKGSLEITEQQYNEYYKVGGQVIFRLSGDKLSIDDSGENRSFYIYVARKKTYDTSSADYNSTSNIIMKKQYISTKSNDTGFGYDSTKKAYYVRDNESGDVIYLTFTTKVGGVDKEFAYMPLDASNKPVSLDKDDTDKINFLYEDSSVGHFIRNDGSTASFGGGAGAPYLIEFKQQVHVNEQVIRGDVQIQKYDLEYLLSEANGANNKSNSTQTDENLAKDYQGTHLDGITFAITNLSNHYVIVDDKVVLPNEIACYITSHWNAELDCYTAETTGGRLPYGTYSIREWSQDFKQSYNLSDTQARIFEIRENGVTVTKGWKVSDTKRDNRSSDNKKVSEYVQDGTLEALDTMKFYNWPVRGDFHFTKMSDSMMPLRTLFVVENVATGERHVIFTDRNGEYSSATETHGDITGGVDGGFVDHNVNTNALEKAVLADGKTLLETIDERVKDDIPIIFAPQSLGGELPDSFFNIAEGGEDGTQEFTLNKHACGGLWFSLGENGTYTTWDEASQRILTTTDGNSVVGVPKHTNPQNWNSYEFVVTDENGSRTGMFASDGLTTNGSVSLNLSKEGLGISENIPDHEGKDHDYDALHEDGNHDDFRTVGLREHTFGAMPFGTYRVTEVRTDTNAQYHLKEFEIKINSQGVVKEGGTIVDDLIDVYISTNASDSVTGTQVVFPTENTIVKDTISYEGCQTNMNYRMEGTLWDLTNNVPVTYPNGDNVVASTVFTPVKQNGTVEVIFGQYEEVQEDGSTVLVGRELDMRPYAGHTIVIFEKLYDNHDEVVADHVDPDDKYQMLYLPGLDSITYGVEQGSSVSVTDHLNYSNVKYGDGYSYAILNGISKMNGEVLTTDDVKMFGKSDIFRNESGQKLTVSEDEAVTNYFTYKSVPEPGDYTLATALYDKTAGDYVRDSEGNIMGSSTNFWAGEEGGKLENTFHIDTSELSGHEIACLELFYRFNGGYVNFDFATNTMNGFALNANIPISAEQKSGFLTVGQKYDLTFTLRDSNDRDIKDLNGDPLVYSVEDYTARFEGVDQVPVTFLADNENADTLRSGTDEGDGEEPAVKKFGVDADIMFSNNVYLNVSVKPAGGSQTRAFELDGGQILAERFDGTAYLDGAPVYTADKTVKVDDAGYLSGASNMPYIVKCTSDVVKDRVLTTGLTKGTEYKLIVNLIGKIGSGKKAESVDVSTKEVVFTADNSFMYHDVLFEQIDMTPYDSFVVTEKVVREGIDKEDVKYKTGASHTEKEVFVKKIEYVKDGNGNEVDEDFGNYFLKAVRVYPQDSDGTVDVSFDLNTNKMYGVRLVFMDEMYVIDRLGNYYICTVHADVNDVDEQFKTGYVYYPNEGGPGTTPPGTTFKTTATVNNSHTFAPTGTVTIRDVVTYSGYTQYAGQTLKMHGELMDKQTGKNFTVNGKPVVAEQEFVVEKDGAGSVVMEFKIDASVLGENHKLVVFEKMLDLSAKVIASHEDINDTDQTVGTPGPEISTLATVNNDKVYEYKLSSSGAKPSGTLTIKDVVSYSGLGKYANQSLTMQGTLMDKETGSPFKVNGKEVKASTKFTVSGTGTGTVTMEFKVNLSAIEGGESFVVFEKLLDTEGKVVVSHEDINDEDQTVDITKPEEPEDKTKVTEPYLKTTAKTGDNQKVINVDQITSKNGKVTITDTVEYGGYGTGERLTMQGTLMDKSTKQPLKDANGQPVTASTSFTTKAQGVVEVKFTFDVSILKSGMDLVVFEKMLTMSGEEKGSHEDYNDAGQTINIRDDKTIGDQPHFKTTATADGKKTVTNTGEVIIKDVVEYGGYTKGEQYIMIAYLVDKKTGEVLCDSDGNVITGTKKFTCEGTGKVEVTFPAFDMSVMEPGDELVCFENMCDKDGNIIASHLDLSDAAQTIYIKDIAPRSDTQTGVYVFEWLSFAGVAGALVWFFRKRISKFLSR